MPDSRLTAGELRLLEARLRARRDSLKHELRGLTESLREVRQARSTESADDEHDPEGPTLSSEWSRIHGVHGELMSSSVALDAAIERVSARTYGVCVRCGSPIGFERLEARPEAALCIGCARKAEY